MCQCVNADSVRCLAIRHNVSLTMAAILNGCDCECHFTEGGKPIPAETWVRRKKSQWKPGPPEVK